ncbi:MAG: hypothetical protein E5X48_22995 [Mesorhizobium sp.]|uniref:hypothetical protein n=1 Tax=Mesorhizobium sp. TaxID=1871066 RepID=UPI0012150791|nr:hypothetical protein [Mesorhizobium sp.]TIQ33527.1 MAG: hypothetical protein E5X48_22995 [Mesorhizobium sp.]
MKVLRWEAADLAEELGHPSTDVARWLDGRARVPLAVAAWIEALVKAHKALPPPGPSQAEVTAPTSSAEPVARPEAVPAAAPAIRLPEPRGIVLRTPYPRRQALAGGPRPDPMAAQPNGASDHGTRPL